MSSSSRFAPLVAAAALLISAGCRSTAVQPTHDTFDRVCRVAEERRLLPRTYELLESLADRHVGRERQLARLETAITEDFSRFNAADDPRFVWAHEVESYARMLYLPPEGDVSPATRMRPAARRLIRFEQTVNLARLAASGDSAAEREQLLLALRLATGWPDERILGFDFSSLPVPESLPVAESSGTPDSCGAQLVRLSAELLALCGRVDIPTSVGEKELAKLRDARIALAESYLARAVREWRDGETPARLAAWRIAAARRELERDFPGEK